MQTRAPLASKAKVLLVVALAAAVAAGAGIYAYSMQQISLLNENLAEKTRELEEQRLEIEQKSSQLESLTLQIEALEGRIAERDAENQNMAQTISTQSSEIEALRVQAAALAGEIQELEDGLEERDDEIAALTGQVQDAQSQLESFKRTKVSHYSVAINQFDRGIVLPIEVEIIPSGEGTVSIDVKNVEYETGFQDSVRTAVDVASEYSGVPVADKDIIIRVINDRGGVITLDGGSAGALLTGMIAAGLMDLELDPLVFVTGAIEPDGDVDNVNGIEEKADAADDFGGEIILVPEEQEFDHGSIRVIGVSDIDDIMRYLVS